MLLLRAKNHYVRSVQSPDDFQGIVLGYPYSLVIVLKALLTPEVVMIFGTFNSFMDDLII